MRCYIYLTLPDVRVLRTENPEDDRVHASCATPRRVATAAKPKRVQRWVPYNRISSQLKRAVLVAEDSAFWQHDGIDYQQIRESMEINLERWSSPAAPARSLSSSRRICICRRRRTRCERCKELLIARRLEVELTKQRILEIYLNVIEWGDGIYGAEAAARTYFRKSAAALTADESALLAAAIINPRVLNPAVPLRGCARGSR